MPFQHLIEGLQDPVETNEGTGSIFDFNAKDGNKHIGTENEKTEQQEAENQEGVATGEEVSRSSSSTDEKEHRARRKTVALMKFKCVICAPCV